ncbi:MAG: outer membrane beta-barrel protein [Bacteroidales bacterium]|nr:outer membrane beta-barrel protein [Bacteroidales bacterium]
MKKTSLLLILLFVFTSFSQAQLISERTNGKVIIGADLFTDISTGKAYENFDLRGINQGVSVYSMFNFEFENTPHFASIGIGFTGHNFYMKDAFLATPYGDEINFENVIYDYDRSKINTNYIDIPVEVSFKFMDQFKISAGFKFGILTYGKSKYVGELYNDDKTWRIKYGKINNLEKYVYSLTVRAAYKSVHLFMAYQFSDTFKNGFGPSIKPFSIGIGVRPF